jgi:hypothetical protein
MTKPGLRNELWFRMDTNHRRPGRAIIASVTQTRTKQTLPQALRPTGLAGMTGMTGFVP